MSAAPTSPCRARPAFWSPPPPVCRRPCAICAARPPKILAATFSNPLKITFPPDGARIDLGLIHAAEQERPELALKAQGGVPPLTWMINGATLKQDAEAQNQRHEASWTPDGAGFARVSVIDADGAGDSVLVRIE